MKVDWKWFAIVMMAVVIVALLQRGCRGRGETVRVTTVTRTDTLHVTDTVFFPAPYLVTYPVTMPADIDTAAVIRDYYSRKSYSIPYADTAIKAVTDITVTGNAVERVTLDWELLNKTTVTTRTVRTEPKVAVTLGGGLTFSIPDRKPGFELVLGVNIRRNQVYAGYDFVNMTPRIGWQYQIFRN